MNLVELRQDFTPGRALFLINTVRRAAHTELLLQRGLLLNYSLKRPTIAVPESIRFLVYLGQDNFS